MSALIIVLPKKSVKKFSDEFSKYVLQKDEFSKSALQCGRVFYRTRFPYTRRGIHLLVCGRSNCRATRVGMGHHQTPRALTHNLHRQSVATQGNWASVSGDPSPKIPPKRSTGPDEPSVDTRAQRNPQQRVRRHRSQNSRFYHQRPS